MITTFTGFRTSDGSTFDTKQAAEGHEFAYVVACELQDISTYGELSINDVVEYIVKNFVRKDNA